MTGHKTFLADLKSINKHDQLDSNNPSAPKDAGNVQRGRTHKFTVQQSMHAVICPWSFLDVGNVQRDNAYHAICISKYLTDYLKTQEMCEKAVKDDSSSLQYVHDWFVTREWEYMWYDDYYDDDGDHGDDDDEDRFFEWYDGYKKWKAQKVSIKEELLPIAWHPSRYWDWCVPQDEKKRNRKIWGIKIHFLCLVTRYKKSFGLKGL